MNIRKETTLTATSKLETGEPIMTFSGKISTDNPNDMKYTAAVMNQSLYRSNRAAAKADQAAFEDALYAEQDAMLEAQAEQEVTE